MGNCPWAGWIQVDRWDLSFRFLPLCQVCRNISYAVTKFLESREWSRRGMGKPQTYHVGDIIEPSRMLCKSALPFPPSQKKEQRSAEKNRWVWCSSSCYNTAGGGKPYKFFSWLKRIPVKGFIQVLLENTAPFFLHPRVQTRSMATRPCGRAQRWGGNVIFFPDDFPPSNLSCYL